MRTRISSLALPVLLAAFLTACGGDSDKLPVTSAAAKSVKASAKAVITDPKKSCTLLTDAALSTFTGGSTGAAGVTKCKDQINKGDKLPASATVVVLSVTGSRATVGFTDALATGAMQMLNVDGTWKMDRVTTIPAS